MTALLDLAARCEAATGPDRELDGEIDRLFNKRPQSGDYDESEHCVWRVDNSSGLCTRSDGFARKSFCARNYTTSIDAAMTLVPEGLTFGVFRRVAGEGAGADVEISFHGNAATPALALCAAALRARA